jgi:hypothetical protein
MLRTCLYAVAVFAIFGAGLANADDPQKDRNKDHVQATITKVDPQKDVITAKVMDKTGVEAERTFQLTGEAKLLDSAGKPTKIDEFQPGDCVLITEKTGKITEVRKHATATITRVDPAKGTVTVKMKDKDGKETERTFRLVEDAEYLDSTGRAATLDVFRSGDEVLFIESEGNIKALKKASDKDKKNEIRKSQR